MKRFLLILAVCGSFAPGCAKECPAPPPVPTCHQFQAPGFDWSRIRRILLVPMANESEYPHATFDLRDSLAARMQCAGRFEVVLAAINNSHIACRDAVRGNGRFDEVELLCLAEEYNADAILFGTITQYQPYAPPRVGLSLRLISPADGALIASVDGLWDARDQSVAEQARCYTSLSLNDGQTVMGAGIGLDSPQIFRRFACDYAVQALVSPVPTPSPGFDPMQPSPTNGRVAPAQGLQPVPMSPAQMAPAQMVPGGQSPIPYPPPVPPVPYESSAVSPAPSPTLPSLPVEVPDDAGESAPANEPAS